MRDYNDTLGRVGHPPPPVLFTPARSKAWATRRFILMTGKSNNSETFRVTDIDWKAVAGSDPIPEKIGSGALDWR